jgi:type II secretory pathway component PulF
MPRGVERRLRPLIRRGEDFLRAWEWTWTKAYVAGLLISFFAFTVLVVIPSWMLYFADQTLRWRTRLFISVRDLVVNGWMGVWAGFFIITAYQIQKIRRRLRGERQAERYSGGYR